jgi:multisubunit Na+/H+ antiporter MnhC subunit
MHAVQGLALNQSGMNTFYRLQGRSRWGTFKPGNERQPDAKTLAQVMQASA